MLNNSGEKFNEEEGDEDSKNGPPISPKTKIMSLDNNFLNNLTIDLPYDRTYSKIDKIISIMKKKENVLDEICVNGANLLAKYSSMRGLAELSNIYNLRSTKCGLPKLYSQAFLLFFDVSDSKDDFISRGELCLWKDEPYKSAHSIMFYLTRALWNASDIFVDACKQFWEEERCIIKMFEIMAIDDRFKLPKVNLSGVLSWYTKGWVSILNNTLRHWPSYAPKFRSLKGLEIVMPFITGSTNETMQVASANVIAYSVSESEPQALKEATKATHLLVKIAQDAHFASNRRNRGFSIPELLQALIVMSSTEEVKMDLSGSKKTIIFLMSLLTKRASVEETKETLKLLWTLSFNQVVRNNLISIAPNFISKIKEFSEHEDGSIRKSVDGILWNYNEIKTVRPTTNKGIKGTKDNKLQQSNGAHIMISYDWSHQNVILHLNKAIKSHGYSTWLDVEQMSGSTLDAMASAVEQSSTVLICMSQRYKDSPNCRAEAEYAFRLNKPIIPVRTEKSYRADGWLGILMGTKLYFNIFSSDEVTSILPKIIQELNKFTKTPSSVESARKLTSAESKKTSFTPKSKRSQSVDLNVQSIRTWNPSQVQTWLKNKKLNGMSKRLEGVDGDMLNQMLYFYNNQPILLLSLLDRLAIKDPKEILKLTSAFNSL